MPTTGQVKGNILRLFTDSAGGTSYVEIDFQQEFNLSINGEDIDANYKGVNDWGERLVGTKSYQGTLTASITLSGGTKGLEEWFDDFVADTAFTWEVSSGVTGDLTFDGSARVQNLDINFPFNDVARYTVTFNGIGAINKGSAS